MKKMKKHADHIMSTLSSYDPITEWYKPKEKRVKDYIYIF